MSTHFTVRCDIHDVSGPDIRRSAGATVFMPSGDSMDEDDAREEWAEFLIEHEWCELRLKRE